MCCVCLLSVRIEIGKVYTLDGLSVVCVCPVSALSERFVTVPSPSPPPLSALLSGPGFSGSTSFGGSEDTKVNINIEIRAVLIVLWLLSHTLDV